jgi:hypothetical protein
MGPWLKKCQQLTDLHVFQLIKGEGDVHEETSAWGALNFFVALVLSVNGLVLVLKFISDFICICNATIVNPAFFPNSTSIVLEPQSFIC